MVGPNFVDQAVLWAGQSPPGASPPLFYHDRGEVLGTIASDLTSIASYIPPAPAALSQDPDALFFVSSAPALVAFCVLLCRALQFISNRPRWLQPFINEHDDCSKSFGDDESGKGRPQLLNRLLVLSIFGMVTQIVLTLLPVPDLTSLPRVPAWVCCLMYHCSTYTNFQRQGVATLLVVVDRPRTAPLGILIISCSLLLSQLIGSFYDTNARFLVDVLRGCEVPVALLSVSFILCMPLRDPNLPVDGIGPAFEKPDHLLRSPEDNLTLWQFMSVSWMSPIISVGAKRQLNSEDVWKLGFEFQHRLLHEKFRELRGSVVRRLLSANGVDLLILLSLGTVEALSSTCGVFLIAQIPLANNNNLGFAEPVLLQQLLLSMEDVSAPRSKAVTFAVLSLFVRLVACQSSVFSLWFSRRSYERSRGEMITMLYEKTLSRKIIGELTLSDKPNASGEDLDGAGVDSSITDEGSDPLWKKFQRPVRKFGRLLKSKFRKPSTKEDTKQPASIGKIYNLMR